MAQHLLVDARVPRPALSRFRIKDSKPHLASGIIRVLMVQIQVFQPVQVRVDEIIELAAMFTWGKLGFLLHFLSTTFDLL